MIRDELQDLVMDESTRKTATDWLMQVISGKKPANGHNNGVEYGGSERSDELVISGNAVAVAEPRRSTEVPREEKTREVAQEITAEDLCGAPVVPVIKVTPKDEITADDVCWVPEEMRLKPQSEAAEQSTASKVHIMQPREGREDLDIWKRDPELTRATGGSEPVIAAAEIWREPAAYAVEPTWNEIDSRSEMSEVTAADIMRDSMRSHIPAPSGSDLPSSFRVIRSAVSRTAVEETAPAVEAAASVIDAHAPAVEAVAAVAEAAAPTVEPAAPVIETDTSLVEAAVPVVEAVAPVVEAAAPVVEVAAPVVEAAPVTEGVAPPTEAAEMRVVAGEAEISPEQDSADVQEAEAAPAHPEELSRQELPAELEPETAVEQGARAEVEAGVKAETNVFAHEGFWGPVAESERTEGDVPAKAILRGVNRAYSASEPMDYEKHPEGWFSAWKTMLRLGSVLPWVARALPALESGALGGEPGLPGVANAAGTTGVAQETRQDVAGLRLVQYEIRTTVQDHSMQLKRMEEQLTRVRESMDSRSSEDAEVAENLRAMTKLIRMAGVGLGALLLVLIVLVIVMLAYH